jgi:hypothetical protein
MQNLDYENLALNRLRAPVTSASGKFRSHHRTGEHIIKSGTNVLEAL